ncbi:MAG: methyl-accepting chemotaxis protein, partial [Spirochaetota bacterium]
TNHSEKMIKEEAENNKKQYTVIAGILEKIQTISSGMMINVSSFRSTAQSLTSSTQEQAASLEESTASMEEIASAIKRVSSDAETQTGAVEKIDRSIDELNKSISDVSVKAGAVMSESQHAIAQGEEAADISAHALDSMKRIHESAEKIREITHLITEIADKTNLLALNASIESARAGEAGRGFAVVADEISKLADNSTSSAKEISVLIRETSENINNSYEMFNILYGHIRNINETLVVSSNVSGEVNASSEVQLKMSGLVREEIRSVRTLSNSISNAMSEQAVAADELAKSFDMISRITQETTATSEEVSAATEGLVENIGRLVEIADAAQKS